jgi:hypothetical protein
LSADPASELGLEIGEPHVIRPQLPADLDMMGAPVVTAIDKQARKARVPHFAEGDLLRAGEGGHALFKRRPLTSASRYRLGIEVKWLLSFSGG